MFAELRFIYRKYTRPKRVDMMLVLHIARQDSIPNTAYVPRALPWVIPEQSQEQVLSTTGCEPMPPQNEYNNQQLPKIFIYYQENTIQKTKKASLLWEWSTSKEPETVSAGTGGKLKESDMLSEGMQSNSACKIAWLFIKK